MYTEVDIRLKCVDPFADIIAARLNELDFESYVEDDRGIKAYIQTRLFNRHAVDQVMSNISESTHLTFSISQIKQENWNTKWENSFQPVVINDRCIIRSDFHDQFPDFQFEIIVTPKMSFGTGHHETTLLVMQQMFALDFQQKKILDIGSGTGILSILAAKLGASSLLAIDIDDWAFRNARENAMLNCVDNIEFVKGDANQIPDSKFDIILANINRNVILADIDKYVAVMESFTEIILSGFLEEDIPLILERTEQLNLELVVSKNKNRWQMLYLKRV